MGVDLTLLPFDSDDSDLCYAHSMLSCWRDRDLFDDLMGLEKVVVPDHFESYLGDRAPLERGYGVTTMTPYGEPIYCVTAMEIALVVPPDNKRPEWEYVRACEPGRRIALYWH